MVHPSEPPSPQRGEGGWWVPVPPDEWRWVADEAAGDPPLSSRAREWRWVARQGLLSVVSGAVGVLVLMVTAAASDDPGRTSADDGVSAVFGLIGVVLVLVAIGLLISAVSHALGQLKREATL